MKEDRNTPPSEVLNELPDYYLGCLIYYDVTEDDNMRWIVYDGRQKVRCISRQVAEAYARKMAAITAPEEVGMLMQSHHFLKRAYKSLDKAAEHANVEDRLVLQYKALEVRKVADLIDTMIAKKIDKDKR